MTKRKHSPPDPTSAADLRIIGGQFRGRKLRYAPFAIGSDPVTRPMKHRVREAIFNLIGVETIGRHAIDMFAGTGALGLEALSRGAAHATFIERHVPTAHVIEENIRSLDLEGRATVLITSAFVWAKRDLGKAESGERKAENGVPSLTLSDNPKSAIQNPQSPWLLFCSPPYDFFVDRRDEMLASIGRVIAVAPAGSTIVVECDERFDPQELPGAVVASSGDSSWDVRVYPPAVVAIWRKPESF